MPLALSRDMVLVCAPMPSRNDRGPILSDVDRWGNHIRVRCSWCRTTRFFLPADMQTLFGDIEIDHLDRKLTCGKCGRRDYVHVNSISLTAQQKANTTLRRLEKIKMVRRVGWRDEKM